MLPNLTWGRTWACLAAVLVAAPLAAQPPDPELAQLIRSTYTKYEYRIPMRDGVHLFTTVYVPNEISDKTYPLLIHRTPYSAGPYGADAYRESIGPAPEFVREGFIFVYQDVRGRWMSEGEYVNMRPMAPRPLPAGAVDEASDTWDTIEWLVGHVPRNNGKAGLWGISYPGFYSSAGAVDSHPALKAVSPQAPIADWFWDDMHRHGAFILPLAFNFFSRFGQPRPEPTDKPVDRFEHGTADGYQFFLDLGPMSHVNERYFKGNVGFWNEIVAHPNYDEFWQSRNLLPHLKGVKAAVLTVGGWFDTEDLYGPLQTYRHFEDQNPGITNTLVMGPWPHGGWARTTGRSLGEADFGFETSKYFLEEVELPFFIHYLKGGDKPALPEALVFETGADRWRSFDHWPPKAARQESFYMQAEQGLASSVPATATGSATAANGDEASDAYISDPSKPVPYTMEITTHWAKEYMTEDQRFAAWRPDVLIYQTPPLEDDLTLAGPIDADLWVSTTGTDSDFIVKVIDVYPTDEPSWKEDDGRFHGPPEEKDLRGTQRLVRAAPFRGRFRNSYEVPEPFVPGQPTRLHYRINDVFHTFQRGHRLMVQIQSTWFP
ncbi:MAG: CocE/NonD family hydrolase, partial [Acidobacteria bacterium]|nr:CocE/NonD family hydrolase [Acidobacteriota bacterium]